MFPMAIDVYDYHSFLKAVAKFQGFCRFDDVKLCKRELAMFLAMTTHESGYNTGSTKIPKWRQGFYYVKEMKCASHGGPACDYKSTGWSHDTWPPVAGKQYYGRGPLQITWNYNYGAFSSVVYGDQNVVLKNPDLVHTDGYHAFLSALWFYMEPQAPKPSMHEIATKMYKPNHSDIKAGLGANFGSATMVINGGLECTTKDHKENVSSQARASYYKAFLH